MPGGSRSLPPGTVTSSSGCRTSRAASLTPLPGTERAALPFWSPDGQRLGFFADGLIKAFSIDDARVTDLTAVARARGAAGARKATSSSPTTTAGYPSFLVVSRRVTPAAPARVLTAIDREAGEIASPLAGIRARRSARGGLRPRRSRGTSGPLSRRGGGWRAHTPDRSRRERHPGGRSAGLRQRRRPDRARRWTSPPAG